MRFKDAVVIVTGGTRGIGRAVSLLFAKEGASVFAAYLSNDEAATAIMSDAKGLPGRIKTIRADVSTSEGAQMAIGTAALETGSIDIIVNNSGILKDCYLAMMSDSDWDDVIKANLYPMFHCCKWGLRKMISRRCGAIINISSVSALAGTVGQTNYSASKGAVISFTKSLSREAGPMGIRVNAVAAGLVDTDMTSGLKQEYLDAIIKTSSLGRIGKPDEIAAAVAFLASDDASYITGQCLVVDGGIL